MEARGLKWVAALVIWAWLLQPVGADNAGQDAIVMAHFDGFA